MTLFLTRPTASSKKTAAVASRHGFDSFIEPLLRITPSNAPRPEGDFQAVFITSSNAPDALRELNSPVIDLLNLPCYCVGASTGEAARDFGFTDVRCGTPDGAALARLAVGEMEDKSKSLLHIIGDHSNDKLATILSSNGFILTPWIVYHAEAASDFTPEAKQKFANGDFTAIPVFSPRSAHILVSLIEKNQLTRACANIIAIGLSQAVADVLQILPWRRLEIAASPTEEDVFVCLESAMTQKEMPAMPSVPTDKKCGRKKFCFLWAVLGLVTAACLGGVAVLRCPAFQPLLPVTAPAPDLTAIDHRLDTIEAQIKTLNETPPAPQTTDNAAPQNAMLAETVKNLQAQIAALQNANNNHQQVASAVAFFDLRDAINNGRDFTTQLSVMKKTAGNDAALNDQINKLQPYAASPPPTWQHLRDMLPGEEAHMDDAPVADEQSSLWDKIKSAMHPLISVRPLHNPHLLSLQQALADNDATAAAQAFDNLPTEVKTKLSAWKEKFDARANVDNALHALAMHFAASGDTP